MSETWTWSYHDAGGSPVTSAEATATPFPSQAEAEAWLGETWSVLADDGVDSVTLHHGEHVVYGPMSLHQD